MRPTPPLIVAGMHRSGTSLTAGFLEALGVDVGTDLLPADAHNPRGYFEDVEFLDLHRRALTAARDGEEGHPDWGWTVSGRLDHRAIERLRPEFEALAARRAGRGGPWGWKDPRTTMLLDVWDEIVPSARYVLVYRPPWDVVDSLLRLRVPPFTEHPDWAPRIWAHYNRRLLEFRRRAAGRTALVSVRAIAERPGEALEAMRPVLSAAGLNPSAPPATVYEHELLAAHPMDGERAEVLRRDWPAVAELFAELEREADAPGRSIVDRAPTI
jgi:hypothetical protein